MMYKLILTIAIAFASFSYNNGFEVINSPDSVISTNNGASTQSPQQTDAEGSIKIAELVQNKSKYDGMEVQITGTCTKVNSNIMGRNWIHLKDGSMDEFDLVITSDQKVTKDEVVTMKGIVVVDKDFGAGYKYDLIIEMGQIVADKK